MSDKFFAVAFKKVDYRNFNHCVAAWLLTHRSTCHANKNLSSKSWVVDLHIEFEQLVVCLTGNAFAYKVYTVTNIVEVVQVLHIPYGGGYLYLQGLSLTMHL